MLDRTGQPSIAGLSLNGQQFAAGLPDVGAQTSVNSKGKVSGPDSFANIGGNLTGTATVTRYAVLRPPGGGFFHFGMYVRTADDSLPDVEAGLEDMEIRWTEAMLAQIGGQIAHSIPVPQQDQHPAAFGQMRAQTR